MITSSIKTFSYSSRSVPLGSVVANSSKSYWGRVHEETTGIDISAEFLAQFHTSENYELPDASQLVKNEDGTVKCSKVELRLYYTSYKGDGSNPMKMEVYELDKKNSVNEGVKYYSDLDLNSFISSQRPTPVAEKTFTAVDQTVSDDERSSESYTASVLVSIPTEDGQYILQSILDHPEYFADSYQFIHNVFPGYYFKLKSGSGTMLAIDVCVLNIYFQYINSNGETVDGVARFSATPEVIQTTHVEYDGVAALMAVNNDANGDAQEAFTYLTSPAGIATELTLPVDEIYEGHENDSISRARIILNKLNDDTDANLFDTPSNLLMVSQGEYADFFDNGNVADSYKTFITSFDTSSNTYTFNNINTLISYLYHAKLAKMQQESITSEDYNAAYPKWNKVLLVPVVTAVNSSNVVTKVQHDFSLCSARILGGTQPLQMQVIYSSYDR